MMRMPPKAGLLAGCAIGALLASLPCAAAAQAFQGNGTVVAGSAAITTGVGGTNVSVRAAETVIDWVPFDTAGTGTIDFLPAGTQARFTGNFDEFTVLNRILPQNGNGAPVARAVSLNGSVLSLRQDPVTFGIGDIWFYSPTGIIVGPTATFNVGSLILTTNDIQFVPNDPVTGTGGSIYGPGGLIEFRGPAGSTGFVDVRSGAQIEATAENSYVALVAPRVVQGGTVNVNGHAAYIGAEQVDMRIGAGLFDFTVTTGTTDENGVVHTGTTTGPASSTFFDQQQISMVAVPKNDALTMLLSGSMGYTPAASALNDGSSIVLSAGFPTDDPGIFSGSDGGNIRIGNANFLNRLTAWATSGVYVLPDVGTTTFGTTATLNAGEAIQVQATAREFVIGNADLYLNAGRRGTGGTIDVLARTSDNLPGGVIDVARTFSAYVASDGILPAIEPPVDGQGGSITMTAAGGTIEATNLNAIADGYGLYDGVLGGEGRAGTIDIVAEDSGTISAQFVDVHADGYGGDSIATGGNGLGGTVTLGEADGVLDFGNVFLRARAEGGNASGEAGDGTGGTATVSITSRAQDWDLLFVDSSATPGQDRTGSASGGGSILSITGAGSLRVNGDLILASNAYMGSGGPPGFTGQGGRVELTAADGGGLTVDGTLLAHAGALLFAGEGGFGDLNSTAIMIGGTVDVTAERGGSISANGLDVRAEAVGMAGMVSAGTATGGTVTVSAIDGGSLRIDDGAGTALARISADGLGSPGPAPAHAFGGTARIIVEDGDFSVAGDIEITANGQIREFFDPPPSGPGHNATGGTASVELRLGTLGTANLEANALRLSALGDARLITLVSGEGGGGPPIETIVPIQGDGGDGTGGTAGLAIATGALTIDNLTLDSSGTGGGSAVRSGATPWVSGNGFGGASRIDAGGGIANIGTLDIASNGIGGDGTAGPSAEGSELAALAGEGAGGNASLAFSGSGVLRVTDATLEANGFGAPGMDHIDDGDATDGGIGTGGTAALSSAADWAGSLQAATLAVRGNGIGGAGGLSAGASEIPPTGVNGDGGAGLGGVATIDLADGEFTLGPVTLEANGTGGDSGDAGSGVPGAFGGQSTGGAARFALIDSPAGPLGARSLDSLLIDASGFGGLGSTFTEQSGAGGAQLTVSVLDPAAALGIAGSLLVYANGCCLTGGTGIQAQISGAPLDVGADIAMVATGPISVDALEPLRAGGFVTLDGIIVNTTGLIQSGSAMTMRGLFGVTSDSLTSGDTTSLSAPNGPLVVGNLNSIGLVTAGGQSVEIHSTGGLDFTFAEATGGDLLIGTAGNLTFGSPLSVQAAGSATLDSSAGSITANDLTAGTFIYVNTLLGSADLGNLVAGTDAAVSTRGGNLTVGNVTAGDDTWLSVFGTDPTGLLTAGNLVTTGLGADDAPGPPMLFGAFPNGAGPAGNVARLRSSGSLLIGDVQSPGRAILVADAGTTTAGALSADEALIVLGRGNIALDAIATEGRFYVADSAMFLPNLPDAYDPASLDGLTPLRTGGGLTIGNAVQAGDVTVAVAGTATAPSWTSAGGLLIDVGGQFTSNTTVSAGGDASITADNDIDLTALTSGGTTLLRSPLGGVEIGNLQSTGAVTARGRSVDIGSGGALSFADLDATAGNLLIATAGNLAVATADATGTTALSSSTGSVAATGAVVSGEAVSAIGPGGVSFASLISGGTTQLSSSNGAIDVDSLVSPGLVSATGRGVFIDGSGPLSFATAVSTGQMAITASGNLAFAAIESDLDLALNSTTGSITATGNVRGLFPNLTAADDILIEGNLISGGTLAVTAGGAFAVEGGTSADDAQITADQGITMASLQSGEITRLDAPNGNILVPELRTGGRVTARGGDVNITSSGSLLFDEARAFREDVRITVADNLGIGEAFAGNEILLDAGGTFTLSGTARGFSIDVTSSDIVLESGARLGLQDATRDVTLHNGDSESETFIGGAARDGDYSLDRDEAARMFVDESITILADGAITVDDLALSFGAGGTNIGAGGLLEISTPDEVNIIGDVALRTSGPDDTFRIDPTLIALDTDTGSIAMTLFAGEGVGGGTPQGRLELVGDTIVAATGANLAQLEAMTDLAAINSLLGQPGGTGEPLSAGTIRIEAAESLFIQNSGASDLFADRRGFAASGLEIVTGSAATRIAINGRILTPSGSATGLATTPLVSINGIPAAEGGQFDALSTINGCVIGRDCASLELGDPPTRVDVNPVRPGQDPGPLFVAPLIELAANEPLITPPLVDEPITGVGNDDLWEPRCEPGEEDGVCPEDDGQP